MDAVQYHLFYCVRVPSELARGEASEELRLPACVYACTNAKEFSQYVLQLQLIVMAALDCDLGSMSACQVYLSS